MRTVAPPRLSRPFARAPRTSRHLFDPFGLPLSLVQPGSRGPFFPYLRSGSISSRDGQEDAGRVSERRRRAAPARRVLATPAAFGAPGALPTPARAGSGPGRV